MIRHLTACIVLLSISSPLPALDIARKEVRAFIEQASATHDIDRKQLEQLLKQAETKPAIIDAISRPAERVIPWHEYRERFMVERRIQQGIEFWAANHKALEALGDVDLACAVTGILGVETSYGRITGRYRVIDALATLAFDYPPRGEFFRGELEQFLLLAREEKLDPANALGSYAGAMGIPQFISSSFRKFAVDADGDGTRNLWSNWNDVIASVANYLRVHGWRAGETSVVDARLASGDLSRFNTARVELNETVKSLRDKGVDFATDQPDTAPAMLLIFQGKEGPQYRVGFNNFYVVTRYNRSIMYARAVHELGHAIHDAAQVVE